MALFSSMGGIKGLQKNLSVDAETQSRLCYCYVEKSGGKLFLLVLGFYIFMD